MYLTLPEMISVGGVANPYISVEVGDEKRRTAVESSTVDPVWDEEIMVFNEATNRNVRCLKPYSSRSMMLYFFERRCNKGKSFGLIQYNSIL